MVEKLLTLVDSKIKFHVFEPLMIGIISLIIFSVLRYFSLENLIFNTSVWDREKM